MTMQRCQHFGAQNPKILKYLPGHLRHILRHYVCLFSIYYHFQYNFKEFRVLIFEVFAKMQNQVNPELANKDDQ